MNPVGGAPAAGTGTTAEAGEAGDEAVSADSQTSSGSTSERLRRTRSQATRFASALESAVSRACSWVARPAPAVSGAGGGGMTAICALIASSWFCSSRTFALADRKSIESMAETTTAPATPTSTGTLVFVRFVSSRGRRLTARIGG